MKKRNGSRRNQNKGRPRSSHCMLLRSHAHRNLTKLLQKEQFQDVPPQTAIYIQPVTLKNQKSSSSSTKSRPRSANRRRPRTRVYRDKNLEVSSAGIFNERKKLSPESSSERLLRHLEASSGVPLKVCPERYDLRSSSFIRSGIRLRRRRNSKHDRNSKGDIGI